jgi:Mrp family chromosome partitioning ATPase
VGEISDALRRARAAKQGELNPEEPPDRRASEAPRRERARRREAARTPLDPGLPDHGPAVTLTLDKQEHWPARAVLVDDAGSIAESCRHLALRLRSEMERRSVRSVLLTSPLRNEGKTTLACDLALAMASLSRGRTVALVDLDLRRPSIASYFRIISDQGVEDYLVESAELEDICVSVDKPALDVYPTRAPHPAAHELLVQPRFAEFVRELEQHYATVILDTPPALLVPDASLILTHAGAYAAVARAGTTRRRAYKKMVRMLPPDRLIGGILNEGSAASFKKNYGYYQ